MSYTHWEVAKAFADRDPYTKKGFPKRGSNVFIDTSGTIIYSYGHHFPMAIADDEKKLFIINGDRYSSSTAKHQNDVRAAVRASNYASITVPFDALRQANLVSTYYDINIKLLDEGQEVEIYRCDTCDRDLTREEYYTHQEDMGVKVTGHRKQLSTTFGYRGTTTHQVFNKPRHRTRYTHLLAPSLFKSGNRYFLSGFDETARAWNGGYFLSELPHKCNTIEEAFAMLAPEVVKRAKKSGIPVKRQGDIFAIETIKTTRKLHSKGTRLPKYKMTPILDWFDNPIGYEKSEQFEDYKQQKEIKGGPRPRLLNTNHYATEAVSVMERGKEVVYARGILYHRPEWREADHRNILLGKKWHRIERNTALGSWGVSGRVD